MDSTTESIVHTSGSWLQGYLEVDPYATSALVGLAVIAALHFVWRRRRRGERPGQP